MRNRKKKKVRRVSQHSDRTLKKKPTTHSVPAKNDPDKLNSHTAARLAYHLLRSQHGLPKVKSQKYLRDNHQSVVERIRHARKSKRPQLVKDFVQSLKGKDQSLLLTALETADVKTNPDESGTYEIVADHVKDVQWIWERWLAKGFVTAIAGEPGSGKSTFVLASIAKPIILGGTLPDGTKIRKRLGKVLWIDTESTQALTVTRAKQNGIPLGGLLTIDKDPFSSFSLSNEKDLDKLRDRIATHKPALAVIDSLRSSHRADENSSGVATVLEPLQRISRDANIPIIVVHHLRKGSTSGEIHQDHLRGSSAISAACRVVIGIGPAAAGGWRSVSVLKTNLSEIPDPFGFVISDKGLTIGDAPAKPEKKKDSVKTFLTDLLKDAPLHARTVFKKAEQAGFSKNTVKRSKTSVGIETFKRAGKWYWKGPKT